MKKYVAILVGLWVFQSASAQETVDEKSTLRERFGVMKTKSQTFNDYKVIKEVVLDGVWKITMDSINSNKATVRDMRNKVASLETDLKNTQAALQQKEVSMEEITYAGTHISFFGINFEKKAFVGIVGICILGLLALLGIVAGKLKSQYSSLKEKSELVDATNNEFEDYKRKALDRQTKLSRELQNERNKLTEMKRG